MRFLLLSFFLSSSLLADSCQLVRDRSVIENAIDVLESNYSDLSNIEIVIARTPISAKFEPIEAIIQNPRVDNSNPGYYGLRVDSNAPVILDLGFTFFRDTRTGEYLNLSLAAGCKNFGPVYKTLDEAMAD